MKIYKKLIKEYLQSVLDYMYNTKKDISFWQTQYFITVDTVDEKLEDLQLVLENENKLQREDFNLRSGERVQGSRVHGRKSQASIRSRPLRDPSRIRGK